MKNLLVRSSFQLCILLQLITSCTQDFSLGTGERAVVVECILSCDSVQTLNLLYSHHMNSRNERTPISEANITLFDETTSNYTGQFLYSNGGWVLPYAALPNHKYRLDIDIPGHEHISAVQKMPEQVEVYGREHAGGITSSDSRYQKYGIGFYGTAFSVGAMPEKTWIYALAYEEKTGQTHIVEEICSEYPYVDNFNLTGESFVPVTTHLGNEYDVVNICKYLEGQPLHKRYIRTNATFSDKSNTEKEDAIFLVCGSFYDCENPNSTEPLGSKGGIVFTTVSDDYDRYLQEAIYYQQQQESNDLTSIYKRDNIYTNIEGAIGIFGAKTQCKSRWVMKSSGIDIDFGFPNLH